MKRFRSILGKVGDFTIRIYRKFYVGFIYTYLFFTLTSAILTVLLDADSAGSIVSLRSFWNNFISAVLISGFLHIMVKEEGF